MGVCDCAVIRLYDYRWFIFLFETKAFMEDSIWAWNKQRAKKTISGYFNATAGV